MKTIFSFLFAVLLVAPWAAAQDSRYPPDGGQPPNYGPGVSPSVTPAYGAAPAYGAVPAYGAPPASNPAPAYGVTPAYGAAPAYGTAPTSSPSPAYGAAPGYGTPPPTQAAPGDSPVSREMAEMRDVEAAERANRNGQTDGGSDFHSPGIMEGPTIIAASEPGGWLAGAGVYYLQPHWGNNPAYQTLVSTATASANIQNTSQQDFDWDGQFAPYVYLGYVGPNGFGIRGRYWRLSGSTSATTSPDQSDPNTTATTYSAYPLGIGFAAQSATGVTNALEFDSNLTMDVSDLEFIWKFHPGRGSLILGAGLRYAQLSQQYNANWIATPVATPLATSTTTLSSAQIYDGIGPLVSLEGRYPVGDNGLSIFGSGRGALLIGTGSQQVAMNQLQNDSTGAMAFQDTTTGAQNLGGLMPVLEGEIGAQWEHRMGHYRLFAEVAAVGQAWFSAGNAANSNSMLGIATPSDSTTFRETVGMIGGRLAMGLSY